MLHAAIEEYNNVWIDKNHLTEIGLSRYFGTGIGVPPEVEPDHFNHIFALFAKKQKIYFNKFKRLYIELNIEFYLL